MEKYKPRNSLHPLEQTDLDKKLLVYVEESIISLMGRARQIGDLHVKE